MAKKIKWNFGDVFAIPLLNNKYSVGQVLDLQMENVVRIALYDEVVEDLSYCNLNKLCCSDKLISLIAVWKDYLDKNKWRIIGHKDINIPKSNFPNEQFREKGWIGAVNYDEGLAEDFVNAFYCLSPWDDWYNPDYLDEFLVDMRKKPKTLVYKKQP